MIPSQGLRDAEHPAVRRLVRRGGGKVVEGVLGHADDVLGDKGRAFGRTLLRMLDGALPFEDRPGVVVILRQLREDAAEVHLTVAERTEAAGAFHPTLIA